MFISLCAFFYSVAQIKCNVGPPFKPYNKNKREWSLEFIVKTTKCQTVNCQCTTQVAKVTIIVKTSIHNRLDQ